MNYDMFNEYVERCVNSYTLEGLKFDLWHVESHWDTDMFQLTEDSGWNYISVPAPNAVPRDTVVEILEQSIRIAEL